MVYLTKCGFWQFTSRIKKNSNKRTNIIYNMSCNIILTNCLHHSYDERVQSSVMRFRQRLCRCTFGVYLRNIVVRSRTSSCRISPSLFLSLSLVTSTQAKAYRFHGVGGGLVPPSPWVFGFPSRNGNYCISRSELWKTMRSHFSESEKNYSFMHTLFFLSNFHDKKPLKICFEPWNNKNTIVNHYKVVKRK